MSDSVNVQVIIMKHLCLLFSLTESIYKLLLEQRSEADTGVHTPSGAAVCGFVTGSKGLGAGHPDLGELQKQARAIPSRNHKAKGQWPLSVEKRW